MPRGQGARLAMVDFRYHLVSIIAVFLALAVGIVLGTTKLNGPLFDTLNSRVTSLSKDRDALRSGNDDLAKRLADSTRFGKSVLPFAVGGRLAGERVTLVSAPDASSDVRNGVSDALTAAGALVTGRVQITKKFLDSAESATLDSVASRAVNGAAPAAGTPVQHAANQLAIALATPTRSNALPEVPNAETKRVLSLFSDAGLINVDGATPIRSSVLVVVAALAPKDEPAKGEHIRDVNEVIGAFARQAAAVVAVTPTGGAVEGSVLSSLRHDQSLATDVGSVDDADTPAGQIAVVFALAERLHATVDATGERPSAGHYGDGPGADKPLPDLADVS